MDGFAAEGVPFRLEVPKVVLPEDFASVEVPGFSVAFGGFEAEGAVSGTLGEHPKLAGKIETNEFDPARAARLGGHRATEDHRPEGARQGAIRRVPGRLDDGAIGIDPFTFDLDDTQFTGSIQPHRGRQCPWANLRCAATCIDIARYIPPTDPASEPFVLPTAELKALMFRGRNRARARHARRHRHEGRHAAPAAR